MRRAAASSVVFAAAAWGFAALTQVDLRVRSKVGDSYGYRLSSTIASIGAQGEIRFRAQFTERLAKVGNGELHWATTFSKVVATSTGVLAGADARFKEMDGLQMTSIQDASGRVLRIGIGGQEVAGRGSANVVLPRGTTAVGAVWSAPIEVGGQVAQIRYKLVGLEMLGLKKVARIEGSFPAGSVARALAPTTFLVEVSTGKMVRGTALTEINIRGKKIRLTYRIDRI